MSYDSPSLTINFFNNPSFCELPPMGLLSLSTNPLSNKTGSSSDLTSTVNLDGYMAQPTNLLLMVIAASLSAVIRQGGCPIHDFHSHRCHNTECIRCRRDRRASMGSEPMPKEMLQTRLRFGILGSESHVNEGTEVRQIGFGLLRQMRSPVKLYHYVQCHSRTFSSQLPKSIEFTYPTYNILSCLPPMLFDHHSYSSDLPISSPLLISTSATGNFLEHCHTTTRRPVPATAFHTSLLNFLTSLIGSN